MASLASVRNFRASVVIWVNCSIMKVYTCSGPDLISWRSQVASFCYLGAILSAGRGCELPSKVRLMTGRGQGGPS